MSVSRSAAGRLIGSLRKFSDNASSLQILSKHDNRRGEARAVLKKWLKEWWASPAALSSISSEREERRRFPTATVDGIGPPSALAWLRRRRPMGVSEGMIHKAFREGIVRVFDPQECRVRRAKKDEGLPAGARLLLPRSLIRGSSLTEQQANRRTMSEKRGDDAGDQMLREQLVQHLRGSILLDTEKLVFLNKPAGIPVQGGKGIGISLDNLLDGIYEEPVHQKFRKGSWKEMRDVKEDETNLRLVHRLDRNVTGALLLAKGAGAAAEIGNLFRSSTENSDAMMSYPLENTGAGWIKKEYWAVCVAKSIVHRSGSASRLSLPPNVDRRDDLRRTERDRDVEFSSKQPLESSVQTTFSARSNVEQVFVPRYQASNPWQSIKVPAFDQPAVTSFVKLGENKKLHLALFSLKPLTGRKHQLRIHCSSSGGLNAPILGDARYGNTRSFPQKDILKYVIECINDNKDSEVLVSALPECRPSMKIPPLFLHCRTIEIGLPGQMPIKATAPLPKFWEHLLALEGWQGYP